jgi:hypothetical protein
MRLASVWPSLACLPVHAQRELSSAEQERVLSEIRSYALGYSRGLPDYRCRQITTRDHDSIPALWQERNPAVFGKEAPHWRSSDVIEEDVAVSGDQETYDKLKINGVRAVSPTHTELHSSVSAKTSTYFLNQVFAPETGTSFHWKRIERLHGNSTVVFEFAVPQSHLFSVFDRSPGELRLVDLTYKGLIYADAESYAVIRLQVEAEGFSEKSWYTQLALLLDYRRIRLQGRSVILPDRFEVRWRTRAVSRDSVQGTAIHEEQQKLEKFHKSGQFPDLLPEEGFTSGEFKDYRPF